MKRIALAFALLCSLYTGAHAQSFEDYPAKIYTGPNAPVQIDRDSRMYRTRLRWAVKNQKANFAGHYILTTWGCGTNCIQFSIINARTGRPYFSGFSVCCWPASEEKPLDFRTTSRLLIVRGMRNEQGSEGPHYYEWKDNQLVLAR